MADQGTITSSNSVVTISVPGLFPAPRQLQGYSADRAWTSNARVLAETQMGVDGRMTAGKVNNPVEQTFSLQGDSPSKTIFNEIARAMDQTGDVFYINGTILLPSTGESFVCSRGVLTSYKALPDASKVIDAMDYVITWESVKPTLN